MTEPNTAATIITSLLTTLGVGGAIGGWFALWIKHKSEREIERLRSDDARKIEQLKSNLQMVTFRSSHVFERTADVIETTYGKLLAVQDAVFGYTQLIEPAEDPNRKKAGEALKKARNEFVEYYLPHKIYLQRTTQRKVEALFHAADSLKSSFNMAEVAIRARSGEATVERLYGKVTERQEQLPELFEALQDDFQRVLGFPEEKGVTPRVDIAKSREVPEIR